MSRNDDADLGIYNPDKFSYESKEKDEETGSDSRNHVFLENQASTASKSSGSAVRKARPTFCLNAKSKTFCRQYILDK